MGRLTVLHVVGGVRLQDDRRIVKLSMHIIIISSIYEFVNGNGNGTRSNIALPNMAVEEGSGCTCTTDDVVQFLCTTLVRWSVVQFSVFDDPRPCEFELPTAGDVEWLLFSYT